MNADAQVDSAGNIALKYYQQTPKRVEVSGTLYIFTIRANIAMAWVAPEHADSILALKGGCCGGNNPNIFRYANSDDVRRWQNGGGA